MQFSRAAILYNPAAGGGLQQAVLRVGEAAESLRRHAGEVCLFPTEPNRRADVLAREAVRAGFDLIAPCGGDGTINEALQGVAGADVFMLPLPAGTANVLAWETGLPVDPVMAAAALPDLVPCEVELGVVEFPQEGRRRFFLLMCGAGVDANAVYQLNVDLKKRVGIFAYFVSAFRQLFRRIESLDVQIGDERIASSLTVISKSRLYGGRLVLTPHAHLLERDFDVVGFRSTSPLTYTGYLAGVLTSTLARFKGVRWLQAREVDLLASDSPHVYVQVDGELAGRLPARVRMGPERIRLLLPKPYCAAYPERVVAGNPAAVSDG